MGIILAGVLIFAGVGAGFVLVNLLIGKLIRPERPEPEKLTIYECGEPSVGSAWVQFDVRYYVVALLFVIFDVEVAFFFPWAVVFGKYVALADDTLSVEQRQAIEATLFPETTLSSTDGSTTSQTAASLVSPGQALTWGWLAFVDIAIFFGVLLIGYAYLWRRGDIEWVRTTRGNQILRVDAPAPRAVLQPEAAVAS
ncbi:MAG: NADH-quinone oxidoreductase subunit A [Gemmatales bacterium]|nr:NADH-quinone oxidoreductase subunit A [Gemmatales bacterium]MCS7159961.1 NADH-quinone oxidoreductase subunit A [Gemmatales bacterium]MDW8175160.1 NADH-quinone oxidoreductase subunit A [Gemmatales bacterium]MDW8222056.1 NADH-quinone oxidoreductase subunit A [Gemmatales bacterium]